MSASASSVTPAPAASSSPLPDLVVDVSLDPPEPAAGEQAMITVSVKNISGVDTRDIRSYLYIDPGTVPPTGLPSYSNYLGTWLGAGSWFSWSKTYTFTGSGPHTLYAIVDPFHAIAESNDTNNTDILTFGAPVGSDPYEPDNTCASAVPIEPDGIHYRHTLNPTGDEDWFKVDLEAGSLAVITTSNVGDDGDTMIELSDACDHPALGQGTPTLGNGMVYNYNTLVSGTYYIKVYNTLQNPGTRTEYEIDVLVNCPGDTYEPDNSCQTAREILPNSLVQSRRFCSAGDQDWLRVQANAGETYAFQVIDAGAKAAPQLTLATSCTDRPFLQQLDASQPLTWSPKTGQVYYLKITNINPTQYGDGANYSLQLETQAALSNTDEPNDALSQAVAVSTDGSARPEWIQRAGDTDLFFFNAVSGQVYRIETYQVGPAADPYLCILGSDGKDLLACDDDSGEGLGARLVWRSPFAGKVYLQIQDRSAGTGGSTASYTLSVSQVTSTCDADKYENDNTFLNATELALSSAGDNVWQEHNFCSRSDEDWFKIHAVNGQTLAIQTGQLGADADTIIELIDMDETILLNSNDDYGPGRDSSLLHHFNRTGDYFVRVTAFDRSVTGKGSEYSIRAYPTTQAPLPPPLPVPLPFPVPRSPQLANARTVVVTNLTRIDSLYGATRMANLYSAMRRFANSGLVNGVILDVGRDPAASAAYDLWDANPTDQALANRVSDAVRNAIMTQLEDYTKIEYIVIAGDDRVVPFRRVDDPVAILGLESAYNQVSPETTVGAALKANKTLTDDFYAARSIRVENGIAVYLPDLAVGRLVETPEDMIGQMDYFLANPIFTAKNALVAGYSVWLDSAQEIFDTWQRAYMPGLDGSLIGDAWQGQTLRSYQTRPSSFDIQALGVSCWHFLESAPDRDRTYANDLWNSQSDYHGRLVWNAGQYSGLNVPPGDLTPLDLPEVFARRGASYIGLTGMSLVGSPGVLATERLMSLLAKHLVSNPNVTAGQALMAAKRDYFFQARPFSEKDRKVLNVVTFYGLPMAQINSVDMMSLDGEDYPNATFSITQAPPAPQPGQVIPAAVGETVQFQLDLKNAFDSLQLITGPTGAYYDLDGKSAMIAGQPAQPEYRISTQGWQNSLNLPGEIRGVLLTGGNYRDIAGFDPLVPLVEAAPEDNQPASLQSAETSRPGEPDTLVGLQDQYLRLLLGSFDPGTGSERIFSNLSGELTLGNGSADLTPPSTEWAAIRDDGSRLTLKVEAYDASGISRVLVTYTYGDGQYSSFDLAYHPDTNKWMGTFPVRRSVEWLAQIVDAAGNISYVNKFGQPSLFVVNAIFLPAVRK